MKLYEITEQYQHALTELNDLELDSQTIADTMEGLKGNLQEKGKAVAAFIANREAEIAATKEASKKLSERARKEQVKMDSLREYLKFNMEINEITEIRSTELLMKIKNNPASLVIDDESQLNEYKKEKTTFTLDKAMIKEHLKNGKELIGAHLEHKTRLEIK